MLVDFLNFKTLPLRSWTFHASPWDSQFLQDSGVCFLYLTSLTHRFNIAILTFGLRSSLMSAISLPSTSRLSSPTLAFKLSEGAHAGQSINILFVTMFIYKLYVCFWRLTNWYAPSAISSVWFYVDLLLLFELLVPPQVLRCQQMLAVLFQKSLFSIPVSRQCANTTFAIRSINEPL